MRPDPPFGLTPGARAVQARPLRIGTRGSPLALAQAHEVRARLAAAHGLGEEAFEIRTITTSGDRILDRPLSEVGGKGLFTKEIEEALLAGAVDLAVHSMKDMQTSLPPGLTIAATLPREDVRDAFVSLKYRTIEEMPAGAVLGTSSLRRQAQVKRLRPDLRIVDFRGNVQTRLKKLNAGVADATLLACAGLNRLGEAHRITARLDTVTMLPAVAQGAIGLEIRADDEETARLIAPLNDEPTALCVTAERAFLTRLEGSCRTPIAGLAELAGGRLRFRGMILAPDGSACHETEREGPPASAARLGDDAARELLERAGAGFLAARA
jgi:hydroxymethylbilane synthase